MTKKKRESSYLHKQEEWARKYRSGKSYREIAKEDGVYYRTVQNVLNGVVEPRPKQTYAEIAKKEWVPLYESGLSSNEIAEKYSVTTNTVTKYLKLEGVEIRYKGVKEKQFEDMLPIWTELYQQGHSLKDIADQFDTTPQTVHKYLSPHIDLRWYTETSKKYEVNENYFDDINTQEKAYWLGIVFGTGCTIHGVYGFGIQLSVGEKDKDRIERFKEVLESTHPIVELETSQEAQTVSYLLRIHNKHLYKTLQGYGLKKEKTRSLTFPTFLPSSFYSAFILGYYEGKGSCYVLHPRYNDKMYTQIYLSIVGTPSFLETLRDILEKELGVEVSYGVTKANPETNKNEVHSLKTGNKQTIQKIAKWLYEGKSDYSRSRDIREILKG